ncbi:MAG: hypothetical protein FJY34_01340 [Betaproteobacteria bacterium]|nr:hypothetical protein [Betaproteobacteria bacterium]
MPDYASHWQNHGKAWLNGLAQAAFLDKPWQGLLLLGAIAAISPWSAAGAALGAGICVAVGRQWFDHTDSEWSTGLGSYDGALVGLAWSGVLSRGGAVGVLFPLALIGCLALRRPIARLVHGWHLPVLGVPALVVTWISVYVFAVLGADFWSFDKTPSPSMVDYAGAILAVSVAMATKHIKAAAAAILAASAVSIVLLGVGSDPRDIGSAGLWAFTVAPALFAFPATLLPACRHGWKAGITAMLVGSIIWFAWPQLALLRGVPPLMAPLFLGIWTAALLVLRRDRDLFLDPELQHAAQLIEHARHNDGTLVLTGAGISTASGIPDYTSGAWLAPGVPLHHYGFQAFLSDRGARILYWDACAWFRQCVENAQPNPGHHALAALHAAGHIGSVITQNVDGLHQAAGSVDVVELHGSIHHVHCLTCGSTQPWPATAEWQNHDLLCPQCGGYTKPAVVAFGEGIPPMAWRQAQLVATCSVLLIVGSQLAVSSAATLIAMARANVARCIFLTTGWLSVPVFPGDRVLVLPAERALPVLADYLGAGNRDSR